MTEYMSIGAAVGAAMESNARTAAWLNASREVGGRSIALIGKAGAGKDSAGRYLANNRGYIPVAFADEIKRYALRVDPYVYLNAKINETYRLSLAVDVFGWDEAKRRIPEVRRVLQTIGQAQREDNEAYWLARAIPAIKRARAAGYPVVVTDCRYHNEADWLESNGFVTVRIVRDTEGAPGDLARHPSETELDGFETHHTITNNGSLADLYAQLDELI